MLTGLLVFLVPGTPAQVAISCVFAFARYGASQRLITYEFLVVRVVARADRPILPRGTEQSVMTPPGLCVWKYYPHTFY